MNEKVVAKPWIEFTLRIEGSRYTDHPADKGGPTRYGWTHESLKNIKWPTHPKDLTEGDAYALYYTFYWEKH